jgi:hypothetical protein
MRFACSNIRGAANWAGDLPIDEKPHFVAEVESLLQFEAKLLKAIPIAFEARIAVWPSYTPIPLGDVS